MGQTAKWKPSTPYLGCKSSKCVQAGEPNPNVLIPFAPHVSVSPISFDFRFESNLGMREYCERFVDSEGDRGWHQLYGAMAC